MAHYRCTTTSPPSLAALAVLLLIICSFHCAAAAARPLPAGVPFAAHSENGVKGAADGLVVLQGGAAGNGDELSVSEVMGGAEEEACEEGKNDDECMQRRLLRDAHLDYIYTQHRGRP